MDKQFDVYYILRYNPLINFTSGYLLADSNSEVQFDCFKFLLCQFSECSYPLLLIVLMLELAVSFVMEGIFLKCVPDLREIEFSLNNESRSKDMTYQELKEAVQSPGIVYNLYLVNQAVLLIICPSLDILRQELKQMDDSLPMPYKERLSKPSDKLRERIEYLSSSLEQAIIFSSFTTSISLEKHMKGISFTRLPKIIQDAVEITRELSIDYLLVDSFCIIQGSQKDWEIESARMSEYFGNAQITIAASSTSNAQAGILAARRGVPEPVKEEIKLGDGTICTVLVQERNNKFGNLDNSVHHFGLLSKRGWAFQENVLPTRTIHYTDSELV